MAEGRIDLTGELVAKRQQQAGFADARFTREQDYLSLAFSCLLPPIHQKTDLVLTADQRGQTLPVQGLEATFRAAAAEHGPSPYRLGKALQVLHAEIGKVEKTADEPPSTRRDHHAVGFGKALKAGGQVRGFPHDRLLSARPLADQIADHDQARRYADPDLKLKVISQPQSADCV